MKKMRRRKTKKEKTYVNVVDLVFRGVVVVVVIVVSLYENL